jgi:hypothetical protein
MAKMFGSGPDHQALDADPDHRIRQNDPNGSKSGSAKLKDAQPAADGSNYIWL